MRGKKARGRRKKAKGKRGKKGVRLRTFTSTFHFSLCTLHYPRSPAPPSPAPFPPPPWRLGYRVGILQGYRPTSRAPFRSLSAMRHRPMTRIAILGATGYTALELIKLLLRHPEAEIVAVTSRQEGNPPVAMIHPSLDGRLELCLENLAPQEVIRAGRVRLQLPAARRQRRGDPRASGRRLPRRGFQRRLPAQRPRGLRRVVRPEARRPAAAGQSRLRPARAVPREDRGGDAGGQSGLLSHVGDPGLGPAVEGRR